MSSPRRSAGSPRRSSFSLSSSATVERKSNVKIPTMKEMVTDNEWKDHSRDPLASIEFAACDILLNEKQAPKFFKKILVGEQRIPFYGNPIVIGSKSLTVGQIFNKSEIDDVLNLATDVDLGNDRNLLAFTSVWLVLNGVASQYYKGNDYDAYSLGSLEQLFRIVDLILYFGIQGNEQEFTLLLDSIIDCSTAVARKYEMQQTGKEMHKLEKETRLILVPFSKNIMTSAYKLNELLQKGISNNTISTSVAPDLPIALILQAMSKGLLYTNYPKVEGDWGYNRNYPIEYDRSTLPTSSVQQYNPLVQTTTSFGQQNLSPSAARHYGLIPLSSTESWNYQQSLPSQYSPNTAASLTEPVSPQYSNLPNLSPSQQMQQRNYPSSPFAQLL